MARVVLDPRAITRLAQRLDVVVGAFLQPGRFEDLPLAAKELKLLLEFDFDGRERALHVIRGGDEVLRRKDVNLVALGQNLARQGVEFDDALDLVAEEVDSHRQLVIARQNRERVAPQTELAADDVLVVPLVLHLHHLANGVRAPERLPLREAQDELLVGARFAEAVDAAHARHDHHIASREE